MPVSETIKPVVAPSADGRLELFVVWGDGRIYHRWQLPDRSWFDWYSHGKNSALGFYGPPALGRNADGRLELFAADQGNGEMYHKWQVAPSNGWTDWFSFGKAGSWSGVPAVAPSADGRLELFSVSGNRSVYHLWQLAPNWVWSNWFSHGQAGGGFGTGEAPTVRPNADGRLELFALASSSENLLFQKWQLQPNDGWSDWVPRGAFPGLGATVGGTPVLASSLDGRLELFDRDIAGALLHTWQVAINNGWSDWYSHGTPQGPFTVLESFPTLAPNADGRLELRMAGADGNVFGKTQVAPNAQWTDWFVDSPAGILSPPTLVLNTDGRLEHFVFGSNTNLYHKWQLAPNGPWSDWVSLDHP